MTRFRFVGSYFTCPLQCEQCSFIIPGKHRLCRNKVCIGVDDISYCSSHLRKVKHLRIRKSVIANAGRGLFADHISNDIVFKKGDRILKYVGEIVSRDVIFNRYGLYTAPYAILVSKKHDIYIDAACKRSVASLINHPISPQRPNVKFINGRHGIWIQALRHIKNGEELYVNYGTEYTLKQGFHTTT